MLGITASRSRDPRSGPFTLAKGLGPQPEFLWTPGGRLTLESGVPVSASDQTGKSTVYYTAYEHAFLPIFDGRRFAPFEIPIRAGTSTREIELSVSGISNETVYDIFARVDGGRPKLVLGPAWSSATTRATDIVRVLGRWTLKSDPRLLYLGSIYASGAGTTEDSEAKRFVWNTYQRRPRAMRVIETTDSWVYSTATYRSANAVDANRLQFVRGLNEDPVYAAVFSYMNTTVVADVLVGIALDVTNANHAKVFGGPSNPAGTQLTQAEYRDIPGLGFHYLQWVEKGAGSGTQTFYGDLLAVVQSGIHGEVWA